MSRPRLSPIAASGLAIVVAIVAVVVVAAATGISTGRIFAHPRPSWIVVVAIAEAASYVPYTLAYRQLTVSAGLRPAPLSTIVAVVLSGFGPFLAGGGFRLDQIVLCHVYDDQRTARVQVIGLIALEWAVLTPIVFLCSIGLLVAGGRVMSSMLWPWAIGVPIGFALALWATRPRRHAGRLRGHVPGLATLLDGLGLIRALIPTPLRSAPVWLGMTAYFIAEIAAVYAALRVFDVDLDPARVAVAYGTGYIVSRRSLPVAGAGITEVLLTFSLHWLGAPLGPALAAVVVYRLFNLILAAGPSLLAIRRVRATIAD